MKRILLSFTVLLAVVLTMLTGAVFGIAVYQMGYEQGSADEESCYQTEGEPCEGQTEELVPA